MSPSRRHRWSPDPPHRGRPRLRPHTADLLATSGYLHRAAAPTGHRALANMEGQPVVIDTDLAPRFHIAILNTSNFEFMAGGATAEQARATLRRAWETHAAQTGASYSWDDLSDDVTVVALRAGDALRDKSPIILAGNALHESS